MKCEGNSPDILDIPILNTFSLATKEKDAPNMEISNHRERMKWECLLAKPRTRELINREANSMYDEG
jgi:hypothetical protein